MRRFFTRFVARGLTWATPGRVVLVVLVVVFFWIFILGDQGVYQLEKLLVMKKRLMNEQKKLTAEIEDASSERELLQDPKNLEPVIRHELGLIKPGEVIFEEKAIEGQASH